MCFAKTFKIVVEKTYFEFQTFPDFIFKEKFLIMMKKQRKCLLALILLILIGSLQSVQAQSIYSRAGLRQTTQVWINVENIDGDQEHLGLTKEMYRRAVSQGIQNGRCGISVVSEQQILFLYLKPSVTINRAKDGTVKGPVTGTMEIALRRGGLITAPNNDKQLVFGLSQYFDSSKQFIFDIREYRNEWLLNVATKLAEEFCAAVNETRRNAGNEVDRLVLDISSLLAKKTAPLVKPKKKTSGKGKKGKK